MISFLRPLCQPNNYVRLSYTLSKKAHHNFAYPFFQRYFSAETNRPPLVRERKFTFMQNPCWFNLTPKPSYSFSSLKTGDLNQGFAERKQGNLELAKQCFARVIEAEDGDYEVAPARIGLALIHIETKQLDAAINELEQILALEKSTIWKLEAYTMLAQIYQKKEDLSKVHDVLTNGLKVFPHSFELNYRLGLFYGDQAFFVQAASYLKVALKLKKENLVPGSPRTENLEKVVSDLQVINDRLQKKS
jgi:tetratricopeptide (TPR) repeat protein